MLLNEISILNKIEEKIYLLIKMSDTLLLVDNSYNAFYRINATQNWFKLSHPDIKFDDEFIWEENQEFLDKLDKMYLSSLNKLIKKYNITSENIYFCLDCSRKDIWRMNLYSEYKQNRNTNTKISGIFKYIYNHIIPKLVAEKKISLMSCQNAEADDIIAIIKKHTRENYPEKKIVIITSDQDYLQLLDDKTYIYNLQNKLLNDKSCGDPKRDLFIKVIMGDKSDNIPPIFPKCGSKTAEKYSLDKELFNHKLLEDEKYKQKYLLNKQIIDFEFIPEEIHNNIIKKYLE